MPVFSKNSVSVHADDLRMFKLTFVFDERLAAVSLCVLSTVVGLHMLSLKYKKSERLMPE